MFEEKIEGIVLNSTLFGEKERIVTLFTPNHGVIRLIAKQLSQKNSSHFLLTTPFSHVEYQVSKGNSDLYKFKEGTIIQNFYTIFRNNLVYLETASSIAKSLLLSQLQGKPSLSLYQLTLSYLQAISKISNPIILGTSFQLKLLQHEGLICLKPICNVCGQNPANCLEYGESLCLAHSSSNGFSFSEEQWQSLLLLQQTRSFASLSAVACSKDLKEKIDQYFQTRIKEI
ncbi:MAG: DNA repair protein RecO [Chlamydiae bacterium]|nr:DNA repair protein RecO [Chlamydiota bacterium]